MNRAIFFLLFAASMAFGQVSVYGTVGAVESNYWSNPSLAYGAGASYTIGRVAVGAEVWRSEVERGRNPWLNADRRAEAVLALVSVRTWRGLHVEGGGGVQRLTDTAYGPLFEGVSKYRQGLATAGAFYQVGSRFWMRAGARRLFVVNDHDTAQVYAAVGFTF